MRVPLQTPPPKAPRLVRARVHRVELKARNFDRMTALAGCADDSDRARLIGVDLKTIRRARRGILGEVFMARTVAALRPYAETIAEQLGLDVTLDNLFGVVARQSKAAA